MRNLLLACFAAALLASSCNKEQTLDVPKNRSMMLLAGNTTTGADPATGKWKTSEYKVHIPRVGMEDSIKTDLLAECLKDDYLQFFQNRIGKHLPGEVGCAALENDVYNTRWELTSNEDTFNCYDCDRFFGVRTLVAELADCSESSFTIKYEKVFTFNSVMDTLVVEHVMTKQ